MSGIERKVRGSELDPEFAASVLDGLSRPQKRIESKYLYDAEGSRLFDRICTLAEYYPTRVETALLRENAGELRAVVPEGAALVELGSGSSIKTRILLDALPSLAAYVPVEISVEHLRAAAAEIAQDYHALSVHPVVGDFTQPITIPAEVCGFQKLLFFPGSTIGNFTVDEARSLLSQLRSIPAGAGLLIGVDLVKDVDRLIRAYDDGEGVTAAFNTNLLTRINRELDGDFDPGAFAHKAYWNAVESRIEMHLESLATQRATVAGHSFRFREGETIHTENSHKFTASGFQALAAAAGWSPARMWRDPEGLFSLHFLTPMP